MAGLLALLLLVDARRAARTGRLGEPVLLEQQDRSLLERGPGPHRRGPQAGRRGAERPAARTERPAGRHRGPARRGRAREDTDRPQVVALYDVLLRTAPSPLVRFNRAVAMAMRDGPRVGLALLDELPADLLRRLPVR